MTALGADVQAPRAGLLRVPFAGFLRQAAQAIVDRHRDRWPDLSGLRVLVPDLHAAPEVARELARAGGGPLLLPQVTTVSALAATAPIALRVVPQSVREVELYAALARREPFAGADVWALAAELVALFDRMTLARSPVAPDLATFSATLREAYRAGRSRALEYEATLVHELWWAQAARAGEGEAPPQAARTPVDAATALSLRLAAIAAAIDTPLYALALEDVHGVEAAFLDACAARVPVLRIEPDALAGGDPLDRTLEMAWPPAASLEAGQVPPMRERAARLAAEVPESPLQGRLRFAPADSLEQQAAAIDVAVRRALVEGRGRIAVVALDRLVARRARALLERAGVAVADEAGWLLSTTVAAACVGRLLDVVAGRGYHRDLVDLLRSPFVFADLAAAHRQAAVACIERTLARHDLAQGVTSMIPLLATVDDPAAALAHDLLVRVSEAIARLDASARRPLAAWIESLAAALDALGARDALAADAAGGDLLDLLALRRAELQPNTWRVNFTQWRSWISRTLERANFRPDEARGQVVFTWLAATRLRSFDCLVFAGADAAHLPADDPPGSFFNQQVRARLGLPTRARLHAEAERSLRLAIAAAGEVLVTWQARVAGEPAQPSPWFARLHALHRRTWPGVALGFGEALKRAAVLPPPTQPPLPPPGPSAAPSAAVPAGLAPRRVSVSGYQALVDCPYRFHAQYLLGLRESEAVTEALEKSDFGEAVHGILARFHAGVPSVTSLGEAAAVEQLQALSREHFAGAVERNFLDRAWLLRWMAHIPAYVAWQIGREAEGWQVAECEADRVLPIETPGGRTVELRGRLDRIDRRPGAPAGESLSVLDYKAQPAEGLRRRAADPSEQVQLPCYVPLAGPGTAQTLFVSIDGEAVESAPVPVDPRPAAQANLGRLARLVDRIHDGAPLPANGIEATCTHCDVRGLCRRDHWWAPAQGTAP